MLGVAAVWRWVAGVVAELLNQSRDALLYNRL
jgi:hypothetical protein